MNAPLSPLRFAVGVDASVGLAVFWGFLAGCAGCGDAGAGDGPDAGSTDGALSDAALDFGDGGDGGVDPGDRGDPSSDTGANVDASESDAGESFLLRLESPADLNRLRGPSGDVKYLAPVPGATERPPIVMPCYFQNMVRYPFHLFFLHSFPELVDLSNQDYLELVLRRPTRIWWGGGLAELARVHPITGAAPSLGYTIYAEPTQASELTEDDVVEVDGILKGCVPYAVDKLAFLPSDPFQISWARQHQAALATRGVGVVYP